MNKDYVTTSDQAFAAYLMINGYTAITCVDPENGSPRFDYYLTHADHDIQDNLYEHMNMLRDKFASEDKKYLEYRNHLKKLKALAFNPVRKSQWNG